MVCSFRTPADIMFHPYSLPGLLKKWWHFLARKTLNAHHLAAEQSRLYFRYREQASKAISHRCRFPSELFESIGVHTNAAVSLDILLPSITHNEGHQWAQSWQTSAHYPKSLFNDGSCHWSNSWIAVISKLRRTIGEYSHHSDDTNTVQDIRHFDNPTNKNPIRQIALNSSFCLEAIFNRQTIGKVGEGCGNPEGGSRCPSIWRRRPD